MQGTDLLGLKLFRPILKKIKKGNLRIIFDPWISLFAFYDTGIMPTHGFSALIQYRLPDGNTETSYGLTLKRKE